MVTRDEIYKVVATFLDTNFVRDDAKKKFYLKKNLTDSEINDLFCTFVSLLGNKLMPMHDTNEIQHHFKMNSRYIEIDEKTIKCDEKGRLYVDIENFVNQDELITKLMENQEFYDKISKNFEPTDISMKYVKKFLLKDGEFLTMLTNLIMVIESINKGEVDNIELENMQESLGLND
ncbi:MAG: hypothetical protein HUJ68_10700 [Clostridia bacterium]|nr:hypothetical protein [Clostridia bacterium]